MDKNNFVIRNFKDEFLPNLTELINEYAYGRYSEDCSLNKQKRVLHAAELVLKDCKDDKASTFVSLRGKDCVGVISIRKSSWDTELMGFGVAIIKHLIVKGQTFDQKIGICNYLLDTAYDWFKKEDIKFVFVEVPARDLSVVNALCRGGYIYIENCVYCSFDLSKPLPGVAKQYSLRKFNAEKDMKHLLAFSKNSFVTQRYHTDPYLGFDLAERVYSKWVRTSVNSADDRIVVLEESSKTLGFFIYRHKDLSRQLGVKFAQWRFAVIDESEREKGVGKQLFIATLKLNLKEGFQVVDSSLSMNNIRSLNLHNQIGFRTISGSVVFHLWIQKDHGQRRGGKAG